MTLGRSALWWAWVTLAAWWAVGMALYFIGPVPATVLLLPANAATAVAAYAAARRPPPAATLPRPMPGRLPIEVHIVDAAAAQRALFGDAAEYIAGRPVPRHDYRFEVTYPGGANEVHPRGHATTADEIVARERRP